MEPTVLGMTLANAIAAVTSIVTGAISWMSSIVTFIGTETSGIVQLFILVAFVGLGVSLLRRVMGL